MIVAIGCSLNSIALSHLLFHAFFKSLLFLTSGAILHSFSDNQDIRKKGSLNLFAPLISILWILGSISLKALPFTAGYYSKDFLLEILFLPSNFSHSMAYFFTLFAAFLTNFYSLRTKI
jgi:NADH:ubiquinone oxidoreductase subunit 5 (subunit L)/multisubunit Na+/H+ antiporter MnhA subunit